MSERPQYYRQDKPNVRRNRRRMNNAVLLAGAALTAGGVSITVNQYFENHTDQAIESVRTDAQQADAQREADRLSDALGRAGKDVSARLKIWQGVIARKVGDKTEYIGDPIVLTRGFTNKAEPTSTDRSPSYYGVITTEDGKNFTIKAYEFMPQDSYAPFDANQNYIQTIDTYISAVDHPNGTTSFQAFAFDPAGNEQALNPDGSLLSPGLVLPQDHK